MERNKKRRKMEGDDQDEDEEENEKHIVKINEGKVEAVMQEEGKEGRCGGGKDGRIVIYY